MRRATLTLMATLALVVMFALSTAVAMAGWGYEDTLTSPSSPTIEKVQKPVVPHAAAVNPGKKSDR